MGFYLRLIIPKNFLDKVKIVFQSIAKVLKEKHQPASIVSSENSKETSASQEPTKDRQFSHRKQRPEEENTSNSTRKLHKNLIHTDWIGQFDTFRLLQVPKCGQTESKSRSLRMDAGHAIRGERWKQINTPHTVGSGSRPRMGGMVSEGKESGPCCVWIIRQYFALSNAPIMWVWVRGLEKWETGKEQGHSQGGK